MMIKPVTATLILSTVEQQTVHTHLDTQYRRLSDVHIDKGELRDVLLQLRTEKIITLTHAQMQAMLRHLRLQHSLLDADMMGLEERQVRGGYDGHLDAAWRALDGDSMILQDVIRRLWEMLV